MLKAKCKNDPWKTTIACILSNTDTTGSIEYVFNEFMFYWPSPKHAAEMRNDGSFKILEEMLEPFGSHLEKTKRIMDISEDYLMYNESLEEK